MIIYETTGIEEFAAFLLRASKGAKTAARLAINQVAQRQGRQLIISEMMDEVEFPRGYLDKTRLRLSKFAREGDLEAVITARKRATSLARFASGSVGKDGVRVRVKGAGQSLRNAFLVRLRRGASLSEDNYNVGLAQRVGSSPVRNKSTEHESWLAPGVALLYGPSVDQVFRDVAGDVADPIGGMVAKEFLRQFDRLAE